MKKFLLFLLLIGISCFEVPSYSAWVPETTAKIAEVARQAEAVAVTVGEPVRVGIGNQNFSSYVYKNIGIYGTAPLSLYNNGVLLETFPADMNINISINPDFSYTLTKDDGERVADLTGILKFTAYGGCLGVKGLKRAGKPALYHGTFEIIKANGGGVQFNLVNKLGLEEYLRGVVPNEMPVAFGLEALKAQSIAARNYVLTPRTKSSANYDVVDSVASQVYFGANTEKSLSNTAVAQTEGLVALYNWDLILALYSSTAGGYTESYANAFSDPATKEFPSHGKPYLIAKPDILHQTPLDEESAAVEFYKSSPDAYDMKSPYFRWEREWGADELLHVLEKNLPAQSVTGFVKPAFDKDDPLGRLVELKVKKRGESGKIIELEIVTEDRAYKVYKELVIRRLLTKDGKALPSANVVFENAQDDEGYLTSVKAFGGGFGHGVGMSQFGAGFMGSRMNLTFDKILQHYYTGIVLGTKPVIVSGADNQRTVAQTFYANKKHAALVVDNRYQLSKLDVNINGTDYEFELPTSFFGGNKCSRIDISDYINVGKNRMVFSYPKGENPKKGIRLFVELVEKNDDNEFIR